MNSTATNDRMLHELESSISRIMEPHDLEKWIREKSLPFKELMAYYKCAIMEVETKFKVLNEDLSLCYDRNPIASIESRLKSPRSIVEKMIRYGFPLTVEGIEYNLHDIAGIRVICNCVSDLYMLSDALLKQDDVTLLQEKDYIRNPKPNGYRSLHLIISTPIFLHDRKKMMEVEVQLRTLAMDTWAAQEHQIRYKNNEGQISPEISENLRKCAELCNKVDELMESIQQNT